MVRVLFSFLTLCIFAVGGVFLYFYSQVSIESNSIIEYKPKLTTRIYDRNGNLVANIFDEENRVFVKYEDIPGRIIEALVAIEDTAFFEHDGINLEAIFRALVKDIKAMAFVEGASTITQQLVKNMILTSEKKIDRKIKEMIMALKIENALTKEQILERYFNEVYFGHQYYGIKTAAMGYFKKELDELSLKETAILVGLPKAPSQFDPTRNLNLSLSRANNVISRMYELGWINKGEYEIAMAETPAIYNETLTQNKAPYVVDEVVKEATKIFPDIKTGGYTIETSVDLKTQELANEALNFGYNEILKRDKDANASNLNGAIVVTNPLNGEVLALVGGVDYAKSNFNRATQSKRQTGSSFKPFIYQIALDMGYSTMSEIPDVAREFDDGSNKSWTPKNFDKTFTGYITLKEALQKSRNLASINLLHAIGLQRALNKLNEFGFKDVPPALSIAVGSYGISPLEYSSIYSVFAGLGVSTKSKFINSITDKNGKTLVFQPQRKRILQPEQAYLMTTLMKNIVSAGTGTRARVKGIEIAGKTGTSNDSIDVWFCGFTPEIQAIVWYGNDDYKPMRSVEQGGRTAAPVFAKFLESYIQEYPQTKRTFSVPSGVYTRNYAGKSEYYTRTSPLPNEEPVIVPENAPEL